MILAGEQKRGIFACRVTTNYCITFLTRSKLSKDNMSTTTGIIIIGMFALLCAGFVWKYGGKFKK